MLNLLSDLRLARNLTYISVSHDLAVMTHMRSRIWVMQFGKLVEETSVERLLGEGPQHPYTRHLYRSRAGCDRKLADTAAAFDSDRSGTDE